MLEAVLFDWGGTLARFEWSDELLAAGQRAGLAALGRDAEAEELRRRFAAELLPRLEAADAAATVEYREELRALLGESDDARLDAYLVAEHDAWSPAIQLQAQTHALLDALRGLGLKLGLVANGWPETGALLRRDLDRLGVAERLDVAVFASEAGARKPDRAIFEQALAALEVAPERAMFVGDSLVEDVQGAAALGLATVQAIWFTADPAEGIEPDHQAFTMHDVLNIARRLTGAT